MIKGNTDKNDEALTLSPDQIDFVKRMQAKSKDELKESIIRRQKLQIVQIEKGRPSETLAWELAQLEKLKKGFDKVFFCN